jgi:hypothetical protein
MSASGMAKILPIPPQPEASSEVHDPQTESVLSAIKMLIKGLPPEKRQRAMSELTAAFNPIPAPRAGASQVLGELIRLLPERRSWTVDAVKQIIDERGIEATPKEIHNALGYLNRKGHITRVGHGRYVVDGVMLETTEDLGVGPPTRHEIDDT